MGKLRAVNISTSADGFMAGPNQTLDTPLGVGGPSLFTWFRATQIGSEMMGGSGGAEGIDNEFARAGIDGIGAHILGRNMFGPIRGEWDGNWDGWWGDNPPYHHDVFVLTNYGREPLQMEGGTTFHFVTDGIESALKQADAAANGQDVRVGGGASTIRQYIEAGLLDELHIVQSPSLLGEGESVFNATTAPILNAYDSKVTPSETVTHIQYFKR